MRAWTLVLLLACGEPSSDKASDPAPPSSPGWPSGEASDTAMFPLVTDQDGDGYDSTAAGGEDCDDDDPAVHPGAEEIWYDGVDQDCAGDSDFDADGDGWPVSEDCDDAEPRVYPDSYERHSVCKDGLDNDCNGRADCDDGFCQSPCTEGSRDHCYNGIDDDEDGLVDCEDGDCAVICMEACNDRDDNDQDGLFDCDDDDCLGSLPCSERTPATFHLRGGTVYETFINSTWDKTVVRFSDLSGSIAFPDLGQTCDWTGSMRFRAASTSQPVRISARFSPSSGCTVPIGTTGFLPERTGRLRGQDLSVGATARGYLFGYRYGYWGSESGPTRGSFRVEKRGYFPDSPSFWSTVGTSWTLLAAEPIPVVVPLLP